MIEKWEYLTTFVEARANNKEIRNFIKETFDKKARKHSPEAMIPDLNKLGADGWELLTMEPVADVGGKEDILMTNDRKWTSTFFCVFKRRMPDTALPVVAVADPEQQKRQQEQYAEYYRQQQVQQQRAQQAQQQPPQPPNTQPNNQ